MVPQKEPFPVSHSGCEGYMEVSAALESLWCSDRAATEDTSHSGDIAGWLGVGGGGGVGWGGREYQQSWVCPWHDSATHRTLPGLEHADLKPLYECQQS